MADLVDRPDRESVIGTQAESLDAAGASTLRRSSLSMPEVLAQSVATIAPTAVVALAPLFVYLSAGNGTWLSFVIATALIVCVGYCASQFARRMSSAGSFYVWVTRSLGSGAGHTAGWALQLGYIAAGVSAVVAFGIFGADLLSRSGLPGDSKAIRAILYLSPVVLAAIVASRDVRLSTRISLTLESFSVAIILFLCVAVWIHRGGLGDASQLSLKGVSASGVFVGVVLAIFAVGGFESAGSLGMEARNPYRTVGRAIIYSALLVGVFYVVVAYSQVYGFQGTKPGFASSQAPLSDLAGMVGLGRLAPVLDLGILASLFAALVGCTNAAARVAFTMAHDGMGIRSLAQTHRSYKTPHVAIGMIGAPMALVPLIMIMAGRSPVEVTASAATVATFGLMLAYALVSIAAPVFLDRIGESSVRVTLVGVLGAIVMAFVFWANWLPQSIPGGLLPPLTGILAWLPYIFFAWMGAGIAWYAVVRYTRPNVARQLGRRYEAEGGSPPPTSPRVRGEDAIER